MIKQRRSHHLMYTPVPSVLHCPLLIQSKGPQGAEETWSFPGGWDVGWDQVSSAIWATLRWRSASLIAPDGCLCNAVDKHVWLL